MPGFRITKNTLGTLSDGVITAKNTYYPQLGTAVAGTAGTEAKPVVSGASQEIVTAITISNPSGASSQWFIPCPQGRWRLIQGFARKTGLTGGANDRITIKSVKNGSTSATGLLGSTTAVDTLELNTIAVGTIVPAVRRLDASDICLFDSSTGDQLEITATKTTTSASCELVLYFVCE